MSEDLARRAQAFAREAHKGQLRRNSKLPYHTHPEAVAAIVAAAGLPEEAVAAAHLHDVLEDTPTPYSELAGLFGRRVADLVVEVTKPYKDKNRPKPERMVMAREHYAKASYLGKSIKLADVIHNVGSLHQLPVHDREFVDHFLSVCWALVPQLKGGDLKLWIRAMETLRKAQQGVAPSQAAREARSRDLCGND